MLTFLKSGFQKIKKALSKTRSLLASRIRSLFGHPWNDNTFEQLEQILYEADLGTACAADFVEHLREFLKKNPTTDIAKIIQAMHDRSLEILKAPAQVKPAVSATGEPLVILIVGVNGSGKTTSIAKLAKHFQEEGKRVILAAGDTFRAAAIEQLTMWAHRLNVEIVKSKPGHDPSAVAFDALTAAKSRHADVVIIDTAGRLQNKTGLMQELEKIRRVMAKVIPSAPHETILVLDATVGQNAIDQAKAFHQFTPLTGILLAKLDGSAKGGIILSIYQQLGIPVRWVGIGEKLEDLMEFNAENYVSALFETE
ncbi:MAG TPA: signal recognition particle-docking protein FtsY [Rhabdochlamydiaceae bacterium]|nr:signal recognition particle-docking protein FtsY [Rhabdochlamydiaceae bacterium]